MPAYTGVSKEVADIRRISAETGLWVGLDGAGTDRGGEEGGALRRGGDFETGGARLEGVDVEDDELGGPAAAEGGVGEDAGQGEGGGDLALVLDALEGARGEEREDLREERGKRGGDTRWGERRGAWEVRDVWFSGEGDGGVLRTRVKDATNIFGRA